jgi:hypothetical protein
VQGKFSQAAQSFSYPLTPHCNHYSRCRTRYARRCRQCKPSSSDRAICELVCCRDRRIHLAYHRNAPLQETTAPGAVVVDVPAIGCIAGLDSVGLRVFALGAAITSELVGAGSTWTRFAQLLRRLYNYQHIEA